MKKINWLALWLLLISLVGCCAGGGVSKETTAPDVNATKPDQSLNIWKYREKLRKDPGLYPVWMELGSTLLTRFRERGDIRDLDEADASLVRSLNIQESEEARRWLAAVRLDQHRFAEASSEAVRALEIWADDGIARTVLTDSLIAQGKYQEAERIFRQVPADKRDFYTIAGIARLRFMLGNPEETFALLNEARNKLPLAESGPNAKARAWCSLMMGSYRFEMGNKEAALQAYQEALRLRPDWIEAQEHRAEWESFFGDREQAVNMYERILRNTTRPQELMALGKLLLNMGRSAEGYEKIQTAEKKLRERMQKGDASVYRELVLILVDHTGQFDEALRFAEQDLKVRQDVLAYDSLAWAALHAGNLKLAAEAMREATKYGTPLRVLDEHRRAIDAALSHPTGVYP